MKLEFEPNLPKEGRNPSDKAEELFAAVLPSLRSFLEELQKKVFSSVDQIAQSIKEWKKPDNVTAENPFLTIREDFLEGFCFVPLILETGYDVWFHIGSFVQRKDLSSVVQEGLKIIAPAKKEEGMQGMHRIYMLCPEPQCGGDVLYLQGSTRHKCLTCGHLWTREELQPLVQTVQEPVREG